MTPSLPYRLPEPPSRRHQRIALLYALALPPLYFVPAAHLARLSADPPAYTFWAGMFALYSLAPLASALRALPIILLIPITAFYFFTGSPLPHLPLRVIFYNLDLLPPGFGVGYACYLLTLVLAWPARARQVKDLHGSAGFASRRDCASLYLDRRALQPGVHLGRAYGRDLVMADNFHSLVTAPTATGKTSGPLVTTIAYWLRSGRSLIVYDPKDAELHRLTSGYARSQGYSVIELSPLHPTSRMNPLLEIPPGDADSAFATQLSKIITNPTGVQVSSQEEFWKTGASAILAAAILYVCYTDSDPTFPKVVDLLSQEDRLDRLRDMASALLFKYSTESPHPYLSKTLPPLLAAEEKVLSGHLSTIDAGLQIFKEPRVSALLSGASFRPAQLRGRPVAVYLTGSEDDADRLGSLNKVLLTALLSGLQRSREMSPVLCVFEELPLLGAFPFLEKGLGVFRSAGIRALLCAQDVKQLQANYGDKHALLSHCRVQLHWPTGDLETARFVNALLGKRTVPFHRDSHSTGRSSSSSIADAEAARDLLTVDEFMRMSPDRYVVITPGRRPILASWYPWFHNPHLKQTLTTHAPVSEPVDLEPSNPWIDS